MVLRNITNLGLYTSGFKARLTSSNLPKNQCGTTLGYIANDVNDIKKLVVIITCAAVNEPTWKWTDTSTATATFTVS